MEVIRQQIRWQSLEEVSVKEGLRKESCACGSELEVAVSSLWSKTEDCMADAALHFRDNYYFLIPQLGRSPRECATAIGQVDGLIIDMSVVGGAALGVAVARRVRTIGAGRE
jgi:hypothetical protein